MQNSQQLENAYDTLKDSAGSAEKENQAYIDSLSGKINALKASLDKISMQMLNSDFLKGFIGNLTTGVNAVSGFIDTFGAIPTTITAVVGALTIFNAKFRGQVNLITSSIIPINNLQNKITSLGNYFTSLGDKYKTQIGLMNTFKNTTKTGGNVVDGFGLQLLGLNAKLVATQAGLISTKVAMIALNTAMSMALTMGISAIISGLGSLIDKVALTRSELNELNQEFVTTNSDSEMSNVIDLVNTYEELEDKLSTLSKGTAEYQAVEESLASTQESILSVYPSASKAIEYNTEAKRLNLEATKKLIDKDLELAKADALNILEKNDTKSDTGLDKAIEQYQEYYKVLEKVNDLAEKEETKSVNIESDLSDSGELLVNAKDVDTYKKRVESLNDTLEASYEAYKILGVSNDKYVEKAKKVGEALGYSASQTEELINKLKETDEAADETAEALTDINGDGIIDATDQMLNLAMATDEAKSAVENLADSFSGLQDGIELLKQMKEEYSEYGKLDTDTMSKVLSSGDNQLIALLGDEANFIENINGLLDEKSKAQDEVLKTAIAMAQAEINGSQAVVEATNTEAQAIANLENTKANISNQSIMTRANAEASLVNTNSKNYNTDSENFANKENNKIKGSFTSATERINAEKNVVDTASKNYVTDDKNYVSLANSKMTASDSVANAAIANAKTTTDQLNSNYKKDAQNYSEYINSVISNIRARAKAESALTGGTLGFKNESAEVMAKYQEYLKLLKEAENASKTVSSYVGSGGVSSTVGHGSLGNGSSTGGSSSSTTNKEVENIVVAADWYLKLNNAIDDNNRLLEENRNAQQHASGTNLIRLMKQEVDLMNRQIKAQQDLLNAKKVAANQSADYLRSKGIEIDANDNLINTTDRLIAMKQHANTLSGDSKAAAIAEIELIENQIELFTDLTNSVIPSLQGEIEDLNNSILDSYQDQIDLVADTEKEIYDVIEYYANKTKEAKLNAIEEQISALEKLYSLEDKEDDLAEKQSNLADVKNQMDLYENAQDSAGKAKYEELKSQYDELLKDLNTTIRDNQKDAITDSLEAQKEQIEKDYEEFLDPSNINKIISDAMKNGYINLGDEVLNLNDATSQYLAETTIGSQNLINVNTELLNSYLATREVMKDLVNLNNSLGNNMNIKINSGIPANVSNNNSRSLTVGQVTVQVQGSSNMTEQQMTNAIQKALVDFSNELKI